VNGQWSEIIGTSAAAPDIAGLLALRIQVQHKVLGDVHYWLYNETTHATIMRRGIPGNNGYPTTTGYWDPVLGLGTPYANTFAGTTTVAGIPGSASNPGR
jgi:subtilase family serine protease